MRRSCNESHPRSARSFFKDTELGASCDYSSCLVMDIIKLSFASLEQLSQTESLYLSKGRMNAKYIFSSAFLLTLNLRALIKFNLDHAVLVTLWI